MTLYIVVSEATGKWLDHPRLGPILIAALKARSLATEVDANAPEFAEFRTISIGGDPESGMLHIYASVPAACRADALKAVSDIYEAAVAEGHRALIRVGPMADSQRDFATEREMHKGYVRFSLMMEKGEPLKREEFTGAFRASYLPLAQTK